MADNISTDNAVFNEVLSIVADDKAFEQSLARLEQVYANWINKVGSKSKQILNVGAFDGIAEALKDMNTLLVKLDDTLETTVAKSGKVKKSIDDETDSLIKNAKTLEEKDRLLGEHSKSAQKNFRDIQLAHQGALDAEQVAEEKAEAKRNELEAKADARRNQRAAKEEAAYDKERALIGKKAEDAQRLIQNQVNLMYNNDSYPDSKKSREEDLAWAKREAEATAQNNRLNAQAEKDLAKSSGEAKRAEIRATRQLETQVENDYKATQAEKVRSEAAADRERARIAKEARDRDLKAQQLARDISLEQQGLLDRFNEKQEKTSQASKNFFDRLSTGWAQTFAHMTKVLAIYTAFDLVTQAIMGTIMAPIHAIEEGQKFINDVNKEAFNLRGTLAANVQYSKDFAENFKIVDDVATKLAVKLKLLEAKTGFDEGALARVMDASLSAGAGNYVKNADELYQLVQTFTLIAQSSGRGNDVGRAMVQQIPKLFDGSIKDTSALATGLGMSSKELEKIVQHSKEHKTLLEDIQPLVKNQTKSMEEYGQTHESIVKSTKVQLDTVLASLASPVFKYIDEILSSIGKFIEDNKDKLIDLFDVLGNIAKVILKTFAISSVNDFGNVLINALKVAADITLTIADTFNFIKSGIKAVYGIGTGSITTTAQAASDFVDYSKNSAELRARIYGLKVPSESGSKDLLNTNFDSINDRHPSQKPQYDKSRDELADLVARKKELDLVFSQIESSSKGTIDSIEEKISADKESYATAAKEVADLLDIAMENARKAFSKFVVDSINIRNILKAERDKNIAAVPENAEHDAKVKDFNETYKANSDKIIDDQKTEAAKLLALEAKYNTEKTNFRKKANKEALELDKVDFDNQKKLLEETTKTELDIIKQRYSLGYITQEQSIRQELALEASANQERLRNLNTELETLDPAKDTVKYRQLTLEIQTLTQKISDTAVINELKIQSAVDNTNKVYYERINTLRKLIQAQDEANEELRAVFNPKSALSINAISSKYDARIGNIDSEISDSNKQLAIYQARNQEGEEVTKLMEKIRQLNIERTKEIENKDKEILKSVGPNSYLGYILTKGDNKAKSPSIVNSILGSLTGDDDVQGHWAKLTTPMQKFGVGLEYAVNGLKNFNSIVNNIQQGVQQGGVLGGIGAGVSSFAGMLSSSQLAKIPIVGSFLPMIGGVLSIFGSMFTAAAKRIAEQAKKDFQDTMDKYNSGQATLNATLAQLQKERSDAIINLSGKKGGQDQLDKLLPEFDKQIQQLQKTRDDIISSFDISYNQLQMHSDVIATIDKQWRDINKQVVDYLGAGGDAAKAAEFLSMNLQKIKEDTQAQLNSDEQTAIKDAIQLNDLLDQRNKLNTEYAKQVFDLTNADAIERRVSGAASRGAQLAQMKADHDKQIEDLNSQIDLQTIKVQKESQVFTLANNISDLHRQDEALTLQALDLQIQKWKDMQSIIAGITIGNNGLLSGTGSGFAGGNSVYIAQVNITAGSGSNGGQIASDFLDALNNRTSMSL